jgi:DNA-binding IclR family transcriptional regulator
MRVLDLYLIIAMLEWRNGSSVTPDMLLEEINMPRATLYYYLSKLVKSGDIKRERRGHYCIVLSCFTEAITGITNMS